ncbi:MAG: hypothetical protein Ct9H300mP27_05170 [Chloroflexota bacterium]|nr:MAG: hypothetical protein Ct9H300mP27_05170 [Chloroflexota bacterium]
MIKIIKNPISLWARYPKISRNFKRVDEEPYNKSLIVLKIVNFKVSPLWH